MESKPLAALIGFEVAPEPSTVRLPSVELLNAPIPLSGSEQVAAAFEKSVFNFLFVNKSALGIGALHKCRNSRVDGLLDLDDGRRLALEVKYRMNWEKACQTEAQFRWFVKHVKPDPPLNGALVIFEEFSADWARRPSSARLLENGWNFWYTEHQDVDGLRVDLVRLRNGDVNSFWTELAETSVRRRELIA